MTIKKALVCALIIGAAQIAIAAPATADEWWTLIPDVVQPGGVLYAETYGGIDGCDPITPVTSPGFAAPLEWTIGGNFGKHAGYGKAGLKLGTFVATFTCYNGDQLSKTFTVRGRIPVPGGAKS